MKSFVTLVVTLAMLGGCGPVAEDLGSAKARPSLGVLRSRQHAVHVHAGPVYTVIGMDGSVLVDRATADQLQAAMPGVYLDLRRMLAVRAQRHGDSAPGVLWAGL